MARSTLYSLFVITLLIAPMIQRADAVEPAEDLVPVTTKGFVSVPDLDEFHEHWSQTQFGQLVKDPLMQPLIEDIRDQIKDKLLKTGIRLGIAWDDLKDVYGGEVCLATIQPEGEKNQHALCLLVDVTGHLDEANTLLEKVSNNLLDRGAKKRTYVKDGVEITEYDIPKKKGAVKGHKVYLFLHQDQMVAVDHQKTAESILARFSGQGKSLNQLPAYLAVKNRVAQENVKDYHVRWFIEPFGYVRTVRAANGGRKKRGADMLNILANQGFTAIQGIGGVVALSTEDYDVVHKTHIYAPPIKKEGHKEKYELAARMLDFPNGGEMLPQKWIPTSVATYLSFNWEVKKAFEASKTLVNEFAEGEVFEELIDSFREDVHGPRVDIRKDLINHFGTRMTVLTDVKKPITPKSERLLFAIELNNPVSVAQTIEKAMKAAPNARKHLVNGHVVWEIVGDEEVVVVEELEVIGPGLSFGDEEEEEVEEPPMLPNSAVSVVNGHLLYSSHFGFIKEVLERSDEEGQFAQAEDFKRVHKALKDLGAKEISFLQFSRNADANEATYELLRQGKMPESETLLGKALNRFLGPDEEGVVRKQQIDGDTMPAYEKIRHYFGPSGIYITTEENGWVIGGCLLTNPKE